MLFRSKESASFPANIRSGKPSVFRQTRPTPHLPVILRLEGSLVDLLSSPTWAMKRARTSSSTDSVSDFVDSKVLFHSSVITSPPLGQRIFCSGLKSRWGVLALMWTSLTPGPTSTPTPAQTSFAPSSPTRSTASSWIPTLPAPLLRRLP